MNHLEDLARLDNRYIAVRHGHSLANLESLVVSAPANGCAGYGLSRPGRVQVENTARNAQISGDRLVIFSSDFRRTRETAELLWRLLGVGPTISFDERLRERYFGEFDLGSNEIYPEVWRADAIDADARPRGVESANQVMARVTSLVRDIERDYRRQTILLVSHGDSLQILETAFLKLPASRHRQLKPLATAEMRELHFDQDG